VRVWLIRGKPTKWARGRVAVHSEASASRCYVQDERKRRRGRKGSRKEKEEVGLASFSFSIRRCVVRSQSQYLIGTGRCLVCLRRYSLSFVLQTCNCQDGLLKFLVNRVSWQWIFSLFFFFCFLLTTPSCLLTGSTKTVIQLLTATGFFNFQEKKTVKIDRVNSLPSFLINSAGLLGRRNCCALLQLVWTIFGLIVVQHAIWCFLIFIWVSS
jgi:hypothetical protein